jgi:hypothetical protein
MSGNIFKDAKDILEGQKAAEAVFAKQMRSDAVDWDDPFNFSEYYAIKNFQKRKDLIDSMCPTHICPFCNKLVLSYRSWVISKDRKKICCRRCFHTGMIVTAKKIIDCRSRRIFGAHVPRVEFDGHQLICAREMIGIKASAFAHQAGWSASYQQKLENGTVKSVTLSVAETILDTLERFRCVTGDSL